MIDPVETFKAEARDHLENLEQALLQLEEEPDNIDLVDTAFRAMHTIKGSGGMFGYLALSQFTHHLESMLDQVRKGDLSVTSELIGILLDSGDLIGQSLEHTEFDAAQKITSDQLLQRLYHVVPKPEDDAVSAADNHAQESVSSHTDQSQTLYRIRFKPDASTFVNGFSVVPILRELSEFGDCIAHTSFSPPENMKWEDWDPEQCSLSFDLSLVTDVEMGALEDTFMFVMDDWEIDIEPVDLNDLDEQSDKLGELLVSRGLVTPQQVDDAIHSTPAVGEKLKEKGLVSEADIKAAMDEQSLTRQLKQQQAAPTVDANVRVPAARLDRLMDLVGEMVIVQARLDQLASESEDDRFNAVAEELSLLTTQMRDETFGIRMLPIGTTFGRFRRLVRDLSRDLDKSIRLETQGAETELDKMMLDKLADPLVHLIRNSIDHGIETKAGRAEAGKPEQGTIRLSAAHQDSQVVIRISDDGKGLATETIRQKAIERGLISDDDRLDDEQIHMLIFEAGFSTAKAVTDISGRGVGMDVVKRSIQELGGRLSVDSTLGEGAEITLKLPMTLAIIEGLMVRIDQEYYVIPLSLVVECVEMPAGEIPDRQKRRLIHVRGGQLPYIDLREYFHMTGERPGIEQVVITQLGDERLGLLVDEVIGQHQTVIKRLGKFYEGVQAFSGATIMGDGSVAMILDPQSLFESETLTTNRQIH